MYSKVRTVLKEVYGQDAKLMAGLLASTSAKTTMKVNVALALKVYRAYKDRGAIPIDGMFESHLFNVRRVFDGKELRGRKVNALYMNLIGDESYVCVDRWVMRYYGASNGKGDGEIRGIPDKLYDQLESRVREEAGELGITPAHRQGQIWCEMSGNDVIYAGLICQYPMRGL